MRSDLPSVDRRSRALTIVGLACLAVLAAGVAYLRPSVNLAAPASQRAAVSAPLFPTQLAGVSFGDAEHGAVQLLALRGGLPETYLTANGGRSWTRFQATFNTVTSMQFFGPKRAIARTMGPIGATTLRLSEDGGRTWRALTTPPVQSGTLFFLDSQNGWWIAGGRFLPTAQAAAVTLWRTSDGGGSWRRLGAAGIPDTGAVASLAFADLVRGALLFVSQNAPSSMLATSDGGDTWRPVDTALGPGNGTLALNSSLVRHGQRLLRWFQAIPEEVLRSVGAGVNFDPGSGFYQTTYISISDDGGQIWSQPQAGPRLFTRLGPESPSLDDSGRLLILRDRELWVSDDDGATWFARIIQAPAELAPQRIAAVARGALFGIAVDSQAAAGPIPISRQALIRSTDGGVHWSRVTLPTPSIE